MFFFLFGLGIWNLELGTCIAQETPPDSASIVPDTSTNVVPVSQPDTATNISASPSPNSELPTPNSQDTTATIPPVEIQTTDTLNNQPIPASTDTTAAIPLIEVQTTDTSNFQQQPTATDTTTGINNLPVDTSAIASTPIDTTPKPKPPKKIVAEFDTLPLLIQEGDVISKTLRVINGTEKEHFISVNITYPGGWKALTNTEREYLLEPEDTMYIPIRIVPLGKVMGNTKYLINAYVINSNKTPVASAHFLAEKQKILKWELNALPDSKLYLLNDEDEADFSLNVFNTGNESVELILDLNNFRKDKIILMDTSGKIIKKPLYTFKLEQEQDTNFFFKARYLQGMRNFRLIDTENYRPGTKGEAMKYSIFAQSRESVLQGKGSMFKGKKIDLIRLPDKVKVNPFGKPSLPLIMDVNFANILGAQPIMNALFRGSTFLNNGAMLNYYFQTFFATYFLTSNPITRSFFNIGYFDKKFNVQIGSVGGLGGGGRGISGNYIISKRHTIGGYFTRGPRFINADATTIGLRHSITVGRLQSQTQYAHVTRSQSNMDYLNTFASFSIPKHTFGAGIILSRLSAANFTRLSTGYNANYTGMFFKGILKTSLAGSYTPINYFNLNQNSSYYSLMHNSNIKLGQNTRLQVTNRYQHRDSISLQPNQTILTNQLNLNSSKLKISPNAFYNIFHFDTLRFHSRGLGVGYSHFDYETNRMVGVNLRAGYNKILNLPDLPDYFFLQSFLVFRYRVWSGNIRYTYGSISANDMSILRGAYPQSVGLGLNNQHQFVNPHFVLQTNFTYNYINTLKRHSFGLTPQLYYFTNSGWRFYVTPGYYVSINRRLSANFGANTNEQKENEISINQSVIINAGVRKEFGIPIPWMKTKYPSLVFRAFIDHDGNNKQDDGETSLENVVVKLGEWELLTNEKGFVTFQNIFGDSTYPLAAFSLVDLNGYFPNIPHFITPQKDSSYAIPFVKGIKVHGNVYMDRDKLTPGGERPLDLSGIKISAVNGKVVNTLTDDKGNFSFYVPFGLYTMIMDEKVLGDRFTLLQNNIELELDQKTESIFLTFYIVEKRRKITVKKFDGNGNKINGSDTTITPKPKTIDDLKKEEELKKQKSGLSPGTPEKTGKEDTGKTRKKENEKSKTENQAPNKSGTKSKNPKQSTDNEQPIDKSQIKFKVQIGAYNTEVPNDVVEKIKALPNIEESTTPEGLTRYTTGEFNDYESAQMLRQELIRQGLSLDTIFVIIIADYKGRVLSADEAKELLKD